MARCVIAVVRHANASDRAETRPHLRVELPLFLRCYCSYLDCSSRLTAAQRPVGCSRCSGYRAPCTVIFEAASSISRRSSGVSSTATAPMFSSRPASFDRCPNYGNHLVLVSRWIVATADSHTAEPDSGNLQTTLPKFALLHLLYSYLHDSHVGTTALVLFVADLFDPIHALASSCSIAERRRAVASRPDVEFTERPLLRDSLSGARA
jgi:hypothetical protein